MSRNGRIYGGDSSGTLCIWREPVNMQKLRRLASSNKSMVMIIIVIASLFSCSLLQVPNNRSAGIISFVRDVVIGL